MEINEKEIRFRLAKDGGPLVKSDSYHAIIEKHADQPIDAVPEIAAATGLRPAEIRFYVESVFEHMAENVLADGQPRRFGDLFDISPAITGRFDRIDGEFDPTRHRFVLNLVARKKLKELKRQTPPVNVRPKPRGRIDYVTWPGGEKGELMFGEDIVIVGHDLTLTKGDSVQLRTPDGKTYGHLFNFNADGTPATWDDGTIIENTGFVEWDDNHIRVKWFKAIQPEEVVGKKVTVRFDPWYRDVRRSCSLKDSDHMGSATKVVVLAARADRADAQP